MDQIDAFKLYLGVRFAFLNGYDFVKYGYNNKSFEIQALKRNDSKLVEFLLRKADTPRKLLRLCVGNMLYCNDSFLYSEAFTDQNYKRHLDYMKMKRTRLQEDIDILEVRHYNHNGIEKYLASQEAINDILSLNVRTESYCLINQVYDWFIPSKGYLSEKIIDRIKNGTQFIPVCEDTRDIVQKSWLNTIASSTNTIA